MGSRKKRKSVGPAEQQPAKRTGSQQGRRSSGGGSGGTLALAWGPDGVAVTLPPNQALVFLGRARLEVQSGEVTALGAALTAANGPLEICADERCGGALLLEPGAALGSVPLAVSGAPVFSLVRVAGGGSGGGGGPPATPPPQRQQQEDAAAGEASSSRRALGFEAWLASDPNAPPAPQPLPPLWCQAAVEVEQTLAAAVPQQGSAPGQAQPPVIVVAGAKKVGKSTFARFLLNALLARHSCVAYLDTDCGQPEFTAPGLVSLTLVTAPVLGPPHMHPRRPAASFFIGDTSPANDPVRYLQYTRELYRWYHQHAAAAGAAAVGGGGVEAMQQQEQAPQQLPPLVVNTHGWVKGMGFDVLAELLQGLPVTHMIQIAASNPKKNLPPGSFWLSAPAAVASGQPHAAATQPDTLHWLLPGLGDDAQPQPATSETSARSAATAITGGGGGEGGGGGRARLNAVEQRALQWEALAQQCVDNCGLAAVSASAWGSKDAAAAAAVGPGSDVGDSLAAAVPFEVDAADLEVQVLHSSVPASQLFYALNGSVVGLCAAPRPQQQEAEAAAGSGDAQPQCPPALLPCLGLGFVRAADAERGRLHILTGVPECELEDVTALQLGKLELPASLLQTGAYLARNLCLFSLTSAGTGAGAIKSRNNLLRASQL